MLLCALCAAKCALAAGPNEVARATSGMAARKEAISALPLAQLSAKDRENVAAVLSKTTIFRRLPVAKMKCDPELYLFLMNHPEILANIWQLMEIENVVLRPTGPNTYVADDGDGTRGELAFLHRGPTTHLIYARGRYEGPLFTEPITGSSVLLIRSNYVREPDGQYSVTSQMDAFVHLDSVGLDFLAKTFQPLVCRVADYNFLVTAQFVEALSRTAEVNQMGLQRLAANLQNLNPEVRDEFATLAAEVSRRAIARTKLDTSAEARLADEASLRRTIE